MNPEEDKLPIDDVSGVEERPQNRREWRGALRSLVLPLLLISTIVGGLFYLEQRRGGGVHVADGTGIVELPAGANTTGRSPSTDEGRVAPDFVLETPNGGRLRFSDLRGKPVFVNFWASWCTPCRKEMPDIVRAYGDYRASGLQVVAVDLQENDEEVLQFAADFGMTFPIAIDRSGGVAEAWRVGGPVNGIPSSYFVDGDGVVQARVLGPLTPQSLSDGLAKIGVQGDARYVPSRPPPSAGLQPALAPPQSAGASARAYAVPRGQSLARHIHA
ncbi:MAG: TlpA family protein disulfide reductase [Chloroflexota bacterium]|nr:TlpA family protein disulfide reductase [Chloroflexota bacterium]